MKVLFLASYFPKPDNVVMGTWALSQAQALVRQGVELLTLSFTAWVPSQIAVTPGAKAYASCPQIYTWPGDVVVHYPRWLYYPVPPLKRRAYVNPEPYLKLVKWSALKTLITKIQEFQPDVIYCHHSLPNGWLVAQLPANFQRPFWALEHDYGEVADCHIHPLRKAALNVVAERANGIMAVSHRMHKDLKTLFPNATTLTHHNGINLPPSHLANTPRPPDIQQKQVILSCALFSERKGIPLLVKAFHRVAEQFPNAILRIVGGGPEEDTVRRMVDQMHLHSQVQLLGKQPHARVLQEMAWADAFALVGWDEPFATVYLEAMAAGKPIIFCNDGGICDVAKDGVHGLVIPPKDEVATTKALSRILQEDSLRLTMGCQARKLIERQLTWDAKASELVNLFQSTINNKIESSTATEYSASNAR